MTVSSVDFPVDLASPEAQAVARLLAAATAPPRPHELRGYDSARRAFERAGSAPARRGALVPLRRLIGVKAAAVAGALTVTGVAVAAEADVLPSPIQRVAHQMLGGVGVPDSEPDPTASTPVAGRSSSSGTRPGSPHPTGSAALGTAAGPGGGIPAPGTPTGTGGAPGTAASTGGNADVLALCRAFVAQQAGTGGALSGHDKHTLAGLAGGEDKIAEFCARALATAPAQSSVPSEQPTGPSDGKGSSSAPSPSRDHKPTDTAPPTTPPAAPPSSGPDGTDNGHGHTTPNPTRTPHLNKS